MPAAAAAAAQSKHRNIEGGPGINLSLCLSALCNTPCCCRCRAQAQTHRRGLGVISPARFQTTCDMRSYIRFAWIKSSDFVAHSPQTLLADDHDQELVISLLRNAAHCFSRSHHTHIINCSTLHTAPLRWHSRLVKDLTSSLLHLHSALHHLHTNMTKASSERIQ